jgi:hypothetical protein
MFVRVVSFTNAKHIDEGVQFVRDEAAPVLRQQRGYAGSIASADRQNGSFAVLTRWETESDRDASESALLKVREEGNRVVGGTLSVEYFEEVLVEVVGGPAKEGAGLLVSRATMDPAKVDGNLQFFKTQVLPEIKQDPGLLFVRQLVNRETGDAVVGTGWVDATAMQAGLERAQARNVNAPVTITDRSLREILFVDAP